MIQKLLGALLRFAHREGWLLRLADYFDPREEQGKTYNMGADNGVHTAE